MSSMWMSLRYGGWTCHVSTAWMTRARPTRSVSRPIHGHVVVSVSVGTTTRGMTRRGGVER